MMKIKKCPFCGRTAIVNGGSFFEVGNVLYMKKYYVVCTGCKASTSQEGVIQNADVYLVNSYIEDEISIWNNRIN